MRIRDVKDKYFNITGTRRFIGIQPKTLVKDNLPLLKEDEWYLLCKYDGSRRILFVFDGQTYLIDRNHYFTHTNIKVGRITDTLILDGELLQEDSTHSTRIKIFDVMYLNQNVEQQSFLSRLNLISEYFQKVKPQSFVNNMVAVSTPFKVSEISQLLTNEGDLVESINGYTIDGLVIMKNAPYFRGSFDGCFKFKNTSLHTVDLSIMEKNTYLPERVHLVLGVMHNRSLTKWAETTVDTCINGFNLNVGNIVEFSYENGGVLIPYRNRCDKRYPNSKITADNVKAAYIQPVTIQEIHSCGKTTQEISEQSTHYPKIAETFVPMKHLTPSRVIKQGNTSYKAAKVLNSDGHLLTVVSPQYILSIDEYNEHHETTIHTTKENTKVILATFDADNQTTINNSIEATQSDDILSVSNDCIELLGEESHEKFSSVLNIYLENLEILEPKELEIEFKFGIQHPESGYVNGITESFYNKVKAQLSKDFASERIVFTKHIDLIESLPNNKGSMRETFNCLEDGTMHSIGIIQKKKIYIPEAGKYFQQFLPGEKNPFVIRGTVSQEKELFQHGHQHPGTNWDIKRVKDRISFLDVHYKVDLTKVESFSKNPHVRATNNFELEIELTTLQLESFEWIFSNNGQLNLQWVSHIFGIINQILKLALCDIQPATKTYRTYEKDSSVIMDNPSSNVFKYRDQLKSLIHSGYNHLTNSIKENLSKISTRYFNDIFQTGPNVFKGKSTNCILCAIIYVALLDSGMFLKIQDFVKDSFCNGIDQREFYNAFVMVNKHVKRVQINLWTMENYIELIIKSSNSIKSMESPSTLIDHIRIYFDDIFLINHGCNKLIIICFYFHVKFGTTLNDLFAIINWTPFPNFQFVLCIQRVKELMADSQKKVQNSIAIPKFISGPLALTLISVSSSRFTHVNISPELSLQHKLCKNIRQKIKKLSDIQLQSIFNCCSLIDNDTQNNNCIVTNVLKDAKHLWVSNKWDQNTSLFGDAWVDMLLFLDLFDIINMSELFINFQCTEMWTFIRGQDSQTKSYNDDPKWGKPTVSRKRKRIDYTIFQNSIQLLFRFNGVIYDIKIFANGKYNISGCKTDSLDVIRIISQHLIQKVNTTTYAVTMSTFATKIYPTFEKLPAYFEHIRITLLNGITKTNLTLKPTSTNQFGLKDIFSLFQTKYEYLLVKKDHPKLQSKQIPLMLPPPELRQGRRLLIKLKTSNHDLVTVQVHTTGTMVFSAETKKSMIFAYNTMGKILSEYQSTM